ncbi:JAB domain-containing protein [Lichenicola sp.]|uniref:JAB domain-containing protein n=1 Tax=Lichenicola sp. TaxID=2804529 RepID=UPI003AFF7B2A
MRERVLSQGAGTLADYEILEMLLFLGIPMGDTKPLAKHLINVFGSLSGVLSATPTALALEAGVTEAAIEILGLPGPAAEYLAAAETRSMPVLNNWDRLLDYLDVALRAAVPGQLRALLLDNRNRLLADEVVVAEPGDLSYVLGGRALAVHATALILIRVVPVGPLEKGLPKREAALCAPVIKSLGLLSVTLHDHMLVGQGSWISLRQKGLLAM